jgi:hypothetical protein
MTQAAPELIKGKQQRRDACKSSKIFPRTGDSHLRYKPWENPMKLTRLSTSVHLVWFFVILFSTVSVSLAERVKPRVIATTDGEIDDLSTMVRFLLYSCDFDVAAIIQNNSRYQKNGHSNDKAEDLMEGKQGPWFPVMLEAYQSLVPQLRKHHPDYPSAEYLAGVMRVGNENRNDLYVAPAEMQTKNTEGEKFIIDILLDDDPRPVHIGCWGGANTVASALWRLKYTGEYTNKEFEKAAAKVRIYCIWYQDGGGQWIEDNVKEAQIFEAWGWWHTWDYGSGGGSSDTYNPPEVVAYMTSKWFNDNQKKNHGILGSITPQKFVSEGDTPAWLNLINNGLEAHTDYTLGGWGGRAIIPYPDTKPNYLTDDPGCEKPGDRPTAKAVTDDSDPKKLNWRWTIAAQNDFAARLDWCAMDFDRANHAPVAKFNGTTSDDSPLVKINLAPGDTVTLDATGSRDPDDDALSYNWWVYNGVGTYEKLLRIEDDAKAKASFKAPSDAVNKSIHIMLEVTDDGEPRLKGWRRAIVNVKAK